MLLETKMKSSFGNLLAELQQNQIFPGEPKKGMIAKIPKKGTCLKRDSSGICVLPAVAKIINENIGKGHLENFIDREQPGFCSIPSCTDSINISKVYSAKIKWLGLRINSTKTKIFSLRGHRTFPICIDGQTMAIVYQFVGLGRVFVNGGNELNFTRCINIVRFAFSVLSKIWKNVYNNTDINLRLFCANFLSVLLYRSLLYSYLNAPSFY